MKYSNVNVATWKQLDRKGNRQKGYSSFDLATVDNKKSFLHIFRDEKGKFHLAIEDLKVTKEEIKNPFVNGLTLGISEYKIGSKGVKRFIDLECNIDGYLPEFTEIVKEIAQRILSGGEKPVTAVNQVIRNWKKFWANQRRDILSEEEQIGLICELVILSAILKINPSNALNSWIGPLGEKHDFNFQGWSIEVKGTRRERHIHTINGLDQLKAPDEKNLSFISFLVTQGNSKKALSVQKVIEDISTRFFKKKPDLLVQFNELLSGAGYSPVYAEQYRQYTIEIVEGLFFNIDDSFPKLTSESLLKPLSQHISAVRYELLLEGGTGTHLKKVNWREYFS